MAKNWGRQERDLETKEVRAYKIRPKDIFRWTVEGGMFILFNAANMQIGVVEPTIFASLTGTSLIAVNFLVKKKK